jgi:hypothetical protein
MREVGKCKRAAIRLLICFLGVALLWISSLSAAWGFVSMIINQPSSDEVVARWKELSVEVTREQQNMRTCIGVEIKYCNDTLQDKYDSYNLEAIAQENSWLVGNATELYEKCEEKKQKKLRVIQAYKAAIRGPPFNIARLLYRESPPCAAPSDIDEPTNIEDIVVCCTAENIANLEEYYSNPSSTANAATTSMTQFANQQNGMFPDLAARIEARRVYDEEYFSNRTRQIQAELAKLPGAVKNAFPIDALQVVGLSFSGFTGDMKDYAACILLSPECPEPNGLQQKYNATIFAFYKEYNSMKANIEANIAAAHEFRDEVTRIKAQYDAFLLDVNAFRSSQVFADIKGVLQPININVSIGFNPSIDLIDFMDLSLDLPQLPIPIDLSTIRGKLAGIQTELDTARVSATTSLALISNRIQYGASGFYSNTVTPLSKLAFERLDDVLIPYDPNTIYIPTNESAQLVTDYKAQLENALGAAMAGITFDSSRSNKKDLNTSDGLLKILQVTHTSSIILIAPVNFEARAVQRI